MARSRRRRATQRDTRVAPVREKENFCSLEFVGVRGPYLKTHAKTIHIEATSPHHSTDQPTSTLDHPSTSPPPHSLPSLFLQDQQRELLAIRRAIRAPTCTCTTRATREHNTRRQSTHPPTPSTHQLVDQDVRLGCADFFFGRGSDARVVEVHPPPPRAPRPKHVKWPQDMFRPW